MQGPNLGWVGLCDEGGAAVHVSCPYAAALRETAGLDGAQG